MAIAYASLTVVERYTLKPGLHRAWACEKVEHHQLVAMNQALLLSYTIGSLLGPTFTAMPEENAPEMMSSICFWNSGAMGSDADLFVSQMQDWLLLGKEARMNLPGSFGSPNWQWRMTRGVLDARLRKRIRYMTQIYGRLPDQFSR